MRTGRPQGPSVGPAERGLRGYGHYGCLSRDLHYGAAYAPDDGEVRVLDFGIMDPVRRTIHREPVPAEIPPEQIRDFTHTTLSRWLADLSRQCDEVTHAERHPSRVAPLHPHADFEPLTSATVVVYPTSETEDQVKPAPRRGGLLGRWSS